MPGPMPVAAPDTLRQPRAVGAVSLSVRRRGGATCLADLRQSGSLKALFPRTAGAECQAVLLNTAGGITGGDDLAVAARAEPGSSLTVTTQAAERAYRAQPGQVGRLRSRISVARGARVDWLPQETILFDGCALHRSLLVEMEEDATLLLVEPLLFGRRAMGETLKAAQFRDAVDIRRRGQTAYVDRLILSGDIAGHLARPTVAAGAAAMASLVYAGPDAAGRIAPLRAKLPGRAGASLIREDLIAARILAPDGHALRRALIPILTGLTGHDIPRSWMT